MHRLEHHLSLFREREARLRSIRPPGHVARGPARPFRVRIGESLIRLGGRVAGHQPAPSTAPTSPTSPASPAWTG